MATGAYPRSRGGTTFPPSSTDLLQGLSPLARGNRFATVAFAALYGPIPARAGEP